MPKVYRSRSEIGKIDSFVATLSSVTPPRKVSFEDAHSDDSATSACAEDQKCINLPLQLKLTPAEHDYIHVKNSPSLVRPKTSCSLVELASDKHQIRVQQCKLSSAPVSPMKQQSASLRNTSVTSLPHNCVDTTSSSPWGQFVDIKPIHKEPRRSLTARNHTTMYHGIQKHSDYRIKRLHRPYGKYKRRNSLRFLGKHDAMPSIKEDKDSSSNEKSEKDTTAQIIGGLSRMNFR